MVTHTQLLMLPDFVQPQKKNCSITESETLAVINCLEHFRDIILGYKIRVWTDHTAIQNMFEHKNLEDV